ncbi:MAG: glycoside hydrolase family 3 N-terminal domain-containing protein [Myxococcota bacterium]
MKRVLSCCLVMSVILFPGACDDDTETITKEVVPPCGPTEPQGACDVGETCFEGACVEAASLCSPTNLTGTCPDGTTCLSGGCVLDSDLCSTETSDGLCAVGDTCFEGECVAMSELCSTSNPAGLCPGDLTCIDGICGTPEADPCTEQVYTEQPAIEARTVDSKKGVLTDDGYEFKDLSGDGELQPYEDWRLLEICRARDLVSRMSLDQKVGLMSEGSRVGGGTADGTIPDNVQERLTEGHVRYSLIRLGQRTPQELAVYLNNVQALVEGEPLGIPVTITTDPAHGFGMSTDDETGEQSIRPPSVVSAWPYPMGLGAINDPEVTRLYGDTVRQEFQGIGFRWQLGPMADLATEPRWARVQNTFGDNAFHVSMHVQACVSGFQGVGDGGLRNGIAATMKHFPGAGPNEDGMDSHSYVGRFNVFPGNFFGYHVLPFQAAVDVGVAAVMPCYSIFETDALEPWDQVGAAFSYGIMTELLKEEVGFTGMVTADWGALGNGYNTENLTDAQNAAMFLDAGSHQLGSDSADNFMDAYDKGYIAEQAIDDAATKILEMTFKLGLFENPYVDPEAPNARTAEHRDNGFIAQKKAIVMLDNAAHEFPPPPTGWGAPPDTRPRYLPIDGARYVDDNDNEAPDPGEYVCDTDDDGTVEVYYDGAVDGLVADPERPDDVTDVYGEYDYRSPGDATTLPVEQADSLADADIAVLRITARKGVYFGMDAGVPLSFDGEFPGEDNDRTIGAAIMDRNRVLDALRARDGYTDADGEVVEAVNPDLKIVLVMHMDRPGIVEPFIRGVTTLDELPGEPSSYPLVSDPSNIDPEGLSGVDAFLVEFGAFDRAVLDFLFDVDEPEGWTYGSATLPIEIPSSDAAVEAQFEDLPSDSVDPTFRPGEGMTY